MPDEMTLQNIGISSADIKEAPIFRTKGCEHCFNTGYRGRIGIFEILQLESRLKSLILKSFDANRIQEEATAMNLVSLRKDGIQKVLNGTTTIEEVLRVTQK